MKKSTLRAELDDIERGEMDAYLELGEYPSLPHNGVWLTRRTVFEDMFWKQAAVVYVEKLRRKGWKRQRGLTSLLHRLTNRLCDIYTQKIWLDHDETIKEDGWSLGFGSTDKVKELIADLETERIAIEKEMYKAHAHEDICREDEACFNDLLCKYMSIPREDQDAIVDNLFL